MLIKYDQSSNISLIVKKVNLETIMSVGVYRNNKSEFKIKYPFFNRYFESFLEDILKVTGCEHNWYPLQFSSMSVKLSQFGSILACADITLLARWSSLTFASSDISLPSSNIEISYSKEH